MNRHPPNSLIIFSIALPVALRADGGDSKIVRPLDPVELRAEFEIGRDLPRRQRHCKVGREPASDEGGDGEGDFRKRTLTVFAPSPVRR